MYIGLCTVKIETTIQKQKKILESKLVCNCSDYSWIHPFLLCITINISAKMFCCIQSKKKLFSPTHKPNNLFANKTTEYSFRIGASK